MKQFREKSDASGHHRPSTLEFYHSAVEKAVHLMRQDPGAELDWGVLAETAHMSRYHFLRVFEKFTHASPHHFLIALRMEKAKRMLLETAMGVNEICLKAGYSSEGTFNRVFKQLVGIAPGGFRHLAERSTDAGLKLLLARLLGRQHQPGLRTGASVRAGLQVPEPFEGTVFAGLFNTLLQPLAPVTGVLVRESRSVTLHQCVTNEKACLVAIAIPDSVGVADYFVPGEFSPVAVSPVIPNVSPLSADATTVELNLRRPSIFDLPVLPCLPQLFLELAEAENCCQE